MGYSEKQRQVFREANARWNILCGAVSSGKTFATYDLIPVRVLEQPPGGFMLIGKTERTLKRNVLDPLRERYSERFVSQVKGDGEIYLWGRKCYIAGANDAKATAKIQGITLVYAYGDEVATWNEDVFQMLKSRLRKPKALFDGTCNPDNPNHWLKSFIDDPEIDVKTWLFRLDDNPFLDSAYVENLKREYSGVWYSRYILGEWCLADGLIYPMFDHDKYVIDEPDIPEIRRVSFAVDVGHSNATAFLAIGEGIDRRAYILDAYYHSGKKSGVTRSPVAYAKDFVRWHKEVLGRYGLRHFDAVYVDPSALGFKAQLWELGVDYIYDANNDVVKGIQTVSSVIDNDLMRVCRKCVCLLDELRSYAWDEKAANIGEDKPIKSNDHAMDCMRYFFHSTRSDWIGRKPRDEVRRLA